MEGYFAAGLPMLKKYAKNSGLSKHTQRRHKVMLRPNENYMQSIDGGRAQCALTLRVLFIGTVWKADYQLGGVG